MATVLIPPTLLQFCCLGLNVCSVIGTFTYVQNPRRQRANSMYRVEFRVLAFDRR